MYRRFPQEDRVRPRGLHPAVGRGVRLRNRESDRGAFPAAVARVHVRLQLLTDGLQLRHVPLPVTRRADTHVVRDEQAPGVPARVAGLPSKPSPLV